MGASRRNFQLTVSAKKVVSVHHDGCMARSAIHKINLQVFWKMYLAETSQEEQVKHIANYHIYRFVKCCRLQIATVQGENCYYLRVVTTLKDSLKLKNSRNQPINILIILAKALIDFWLAIHREKLTNWSHVEKRLPYLSKQSCSGSSCQLLLSQTLKTK